MKRKASKIKSPRRFAPATGSADWPAWIPPFTVAITQDGYPKDEAPSTLMWQVKPHYNGEQWTWSYRGKSNYAVCYYVPKEHARKLRFPKGPYSKRIIYPPNNEVSNAR